MSERLISARGQDGKDGRDGPEPPRSSAITSGDGRAGMAGNPGENGQDGGDLQAQLVWTGHGYATLQGLCRNQPFETRYQVAEITKVQLTARGGDGGQGGDGARGQDGGPGYKGRDATRYSSGGDGGPGGDGGRGGSAGEGGGAGAGGQLKLSLSSEDSDLLLGLEWDVSAGRPGQPGEPGQGGQGGPGGEGGDSYSWSETEWYTDPQGKRRTRSRSHRKSGGSSGRPGRTGLGGSAGKPGPTASDGQFSLRIDGRSYSERYAFRCEDYQVVSGDGDDILEFGEKQNRIARTVVKNVGPAPTPPFHVAAVLVAGEQARVGGESHPVGTLQNSQKCVLPDFTFDLNEAPEGSLPTVHQVLKDEIHVSPRLEFQRLGRKDSSFHLVRPLTITFPVALVTVNTTTSLVAGQVVKQEWKVVNRSNTAFPPPHRKALVDLSLSEHGSNLRITDHSGRVLEIGNEAGPFRDLDPIPAGGSTTLTVYIQAPEQAVPYSKATLCASLRLTPQNGGEPRCIQRNPTQYNIAARHQERIADVLLVTHHGSEAGEVQSWSTLFEQLDLSFNVWDVSLHGDLPLRQLSQWYSGKLVIILNTPFTTPHRHTIYPTQLLSYPEFRETIAQHGVSYYVVGEKTDLLDHLIPLPSESENFSSPSEYLKRSKLSAPGPNPEVPFAATQRMDKVAISRFKVRGNPRPECLREKAQSLAKKLRIKYPQQRFHITTVFEPDANEGWLRTRQCGILEVRFLPDHDARAVVTRQVYRQTGKKESFLHSAENLLGLFSAQDMGDKIELLERLKEQPVKVLETLSDAVLLDLTEEQLDLRRSGARLSDRKLGETLNRLVQFCGHDFGHNIQPDGPVGRVLIRVAAGLEFFTRHQMAWWDHRIRFLFGGSNTVEISNFTRRLLDALLDRSFGKDSIWGTTELRERVESLVTERSDELERRRIEIASVAGQRLDPKQTAVEALVRWELRDFLQSDAEGDSCLCSQRDLEQHLANERAHQARRDTLRDVYRDAREAGLTPTA